MKDSRSTELLSRKQAGLKKTDPDLSSSWQSLYQTLENTDVEHRTKGNPLQAANWFPHHGQESPESNSGQDLSSRHKTSDLIHRAGSSPCPTAVKVVVCIKDHNGNMAGMEGQLCPYCKKK